jgi:hypothetical protein
LRFFDHIFTTSTFDQLWLVFDELLTLINQFLTIIDQFFPVFEQFSSVLIYVLRCQTVFTISQPHSTSLEPCSTIFNQSRKPVLQILENRWAMKMFKKRLKVAKLVEKSWKIVENLSEINLKWPKTGQNVVENWPKSLLKMIKNWSQLSRIVENCWSRSNIGTNLVKNGRKWSTIVKNWSKTVKMYKKC